MEERLINILMNTQLLLTNFSKEEWLAWAKEYKNKNIFFGVGLMTHNAFSQAIPFDILAMFFVAEALRKLTKGDKVFVFLADQHAITNQLVSEKEIQKRTIEIVHIFRKVIHSFSLDNFEIIQATRLNADERIRKIFRQELPNINNQYLKHEIADTIWLSRFHNVGIKLGWAMSTEQFVQGHDERFFDTEIAKFCKDISFIHTKSGRTGNKERPRVSPYISIAEEKRLLLTNNKNTVEKIHKWRDENDNIAIKPMLRHLSQIIRLHDQLFKDVNFASFEEKAQILINRIKS